MISPYPFKPRGRLLDVMRQVGDPGLINLAAGLPSVHCVPKADLAAAFLATLEENADEALGYHVPDGDRRLRQLLVDRFHRRGINTSELPPGTKAEQVYRSALKEKVAFCPGSAFYTSDENEIGAMRLNCSRPSEQELVKGLRILGRIVKQA
jgi:DNA-binding transcriptional MocR family regulator